MTAMLRFLQNIKSGLWQRTFSFTQAFHAAARHIAERKTKEKLTPSQPQIASTGAIEGKLRELEARLAGQRP
jgi:hypothetical protein